MRGRPPASLGTAGAEALPGRPVQLLELMVTALAALSAEGHHVPAAACPVLRARRAPLDPLTCHVWVAHLVLFSREERPFARVRKLQRNLNLQNKMNQKENVCTTKGCPRDAGAAPPTTFQHGGPGGQQGGARMERAGCWVGPALCTAWGSHRWHGPTAGPYQPPSATAVRGQESPSPHGRHYLQGSWRSPV